MTLSHYSFNYIDMHTHFFPPNLFKAIWKFFEMPDQNGNIKGWPIKYKLSTDELVKFLEHRNVKAFTTYNYAHRDGVASFINNWTYEFVKKFKNAIPFGTVWPNDSDKIEYTTKLFEEYGFMGIKVQPLVQKFYPYEERLDDIYKMIVDRGKWFTIHAGTAPYRNQYVGYKYFIKLIEKYPNMNIIVAHMGAYEFRKFLSLLDKYDNLYLDTAMIYIPDNIFPERKVKRPKPDELLSYQDRIIFGSDFPNIPYEYESSTKGLLDLDLSRNFYREIFYENAKRLFNIIY